jgi:glycosyltransferase involved in cell wall biosynthesis
MVMIKSVDKEAGQKVSVVICALNEEDSIPMVLSKMPANLCEVLLVDGHSSDNTIALARQIYPGIKVIIQDGVGKGAALRTGFRHAVGDIIVTIDADGSMDPADTVQLIDALYEGNDFVKGSRFLRKKDSDDMTLIRLIGNKIFAWITSMLFGYRSTDVTYGYNGFWRDKYQTGELSSNGFSIETEMYLHAIKKHLKIREIAVHEFNRHGGQAKLRTFRDGWLILRTILAMRFKK